MKKTLLLLACLFITNLTFGKRFLAKLELNGNANDQKGLVQTIVNGATLTTDRHGRESSAYKFDGIDDFIEIPEGLLDVDSNSSFSLETYVYIQKINGLFHCTFFILYFMLRF